MLDETKDLNQDNPSGEDKGSTSKEKENEPETLTREQANKEISDKLAAAGRTAKQLEAKAQAIETEKQALQAREEKIAQKEKEAEDKELAGAETDEEKAKIKAKFDIKAANRELANKVAAFEKEKAEHAAELEAAQETKKEILIFDIAKEAKIDPSDLKDTVTELGLTTQEQIKAAAKRLKPAGDKTPLQPDPNTTKGGAGAFTAEQADKMSMDDYAARRKEQDPNIL